MNRQTQDDYVIGLLLALIIFSSIPVTSGAALWLSVLLLAIVWLPVINGKVTL